MATEMAEVSNRVNFGSWVGRLTCPEKSGQREYPMISGLVRKKRYGIQCPENIGPASTWLPYSAKQVISTSQKKNLNRIYENIISKVYHHYPFFVCLFKTFIKWSRCGYPLWESLIISDHCWDYKSVHETRSNANCQIYLRLYLGIPTSIQLFLHAAKLSDVSRTYFHDICIIHQRVKRCPRSYLFCFRQVDPQLAPCWKLLHLAEIVRHFFAGIPSGKWWFVFWSLVVHLDFLVSLHLKFWKENAEQGSTMAGHFYNRKKQTSAEKSRS